MEKFATIFNGLQSLTIITRLSIFDVCEGLGFITLQTGMNKFDQNFLFETGHKLVDWVIFVNPSKNLSIQSQ